MPGQLQALHAYSPGSILHRRPLSDRLPLEREPKPLRQFRFCQRSKIELTNSTYGAYRSHCGELRSVHHSWQPSHDGGLEPGSWSRTNLNVKGGGWWSLVGQGDKLHQRKHRGNSQIRRRASSSTRHPRRSGGLAGPTFRPRWPGPTGGHPHRSSWSFYPAHGLNSCLRAWRSLPGSGSRFRCFLSRSPARPAGKWGQRSASSCKSQLLLRVK